jgi:beta-lactamase regulating signal transducer with metallopeptidase domain
VELYLATGLRGLGSGLGVLTALLTYSLHALLWAGVVALLVRWRSASFALRHTAWKLALLAPLATTCLTLSVPSRVERAFGGAAPAPLVARLSLVKTRQEAAPGASATESTRSLLEVSGAGLLLASVLGVARFAANTCRQWRRLGPRRRVRDARLLARLRRLVEPLAPGPGQVRLTESVNIDCPLVLGAREICVPLAILAALDDAEVDAVLAHELAHVERRDALWFPLFGVVQAALWFHPVTRWVSVQARQTAELACDERCLELTGEPLALARALTHIAQRALSAQSAVALPTMTRPRSNLVVRVARLTSDAPCARSHFGWRSRTGLVVSLGAVALLSLASSVRVAEAEPAPALVSAPLAGAEPRAQMAELGRRAQQLEAEWLSLSTRSAPPRAGEDPSTRLLEVEQELRHVRQMQAFLEATAVSGE